MFYKQIVPLCLSLSLSFSTTFANHSFGWEVISFQLVNKLILVNAEVNGAPGNFILDTGVKNLILNEKYFKGSEIRAPMRSVIGHKVQAKSLFVKVQLGALPAQKIEAMIINLSSTEAFTGVKIHGLIGLQMFWRSEIVIDYRAGEFRIYELDKEGERLFENEPPPSYDQELALDRKYHLPCFKASINGQKIRLALDTGASTNLISQLVFKRNTTCFSKLEKKKVLASLGHRTKAVPWAVVANIQVGSKLLAPMTTLIYDFIPINRSLDGVSIDGLLGYPFLSQFRIGINFRKGRVYLQENDQEEQKRYLAKGRGGG